MNSAMQIKLSGTSPVPGRRVLSRNGSARGLSTTSPNRRLDDDLQDRATHAKCRIRGFDLVALGILHACDKSIGSASRVDYNRASFIWIMRCELGEQPARGRCQRRRRDNAACAMSLSFAGRFGTKGHPSDFKKKPVKPRRRCLKGENRDGRERVVS
jgi:hypothetical protein